MTHAHLHFPPGPFPSQSISAAPFLEGGLSHQNCPLVPLRRHQLPWDSLHALLEDRIPSGLTDDQIGPLHHHDADKEGRVTRKLHNLPLLVGLEERGWLKREVCSRACLLQLTATESQAALPELTHCCP